MIRLLLIAAIVAVGWYLYRQWNLPDNGRGNAGGTPPATPQTAVAKCQECGVHAPEGSGVRYQQMFFCSPDHLQSWLKRQGKS